MDLEQLTTKIQTAFIGSKWQGVLSTEEELKALTGLKCICYDHCIDDGADNDETEDQYVMRACFDFEDSPLIVHVYYGDVTREIGYVDVSEM